MRFFLKGESDMKHGVRAVRNTLILGRGTKENTAATCGVLGKDDLQSIFKYFAMATGSMIRGKRAKLLQHLELR